MSKIADIKIFNKIIKEYRSIKKMIEFDIYVNDIFYINTSADKFEIVKEKETNKIYLFINDKAITLMKFKKIVQCKNNNYAIYL